MAGAVAGMTALYSREKADERLKQEQEIAMEAETELSDRTAEDETEIREATSVVNRKNLHKPRMQERRKRRRQRHSRKKYRQQRQLPVDCILMRIPD